MCGTAFQTVPNQHGFTGISNRPPLRLVQRPRSPLGSTAGRADAARRRDRRELSSVPHPDVTDVRPFLLDLVTGVEFIQRIVAKELGNPARVVQLALRRLFGRSSEAGEAEDLSSLLDRLGFDALVAALICSREYGPGTVRGFRAPETRATN